MSARTSNRPRRRTLTFIDQVMTSFGKLEGFMPSCFVAEAHPPFVLAGATEWTGATRYFRYELAGASANVRVHGEPQSRGHKRVVEALRAAGYDCGLRVPHETWCRRWLAGPRDGVRELELLDGLRLGALPVRETPARPRRGPVQTLRAYARAVDQVREAGLRWREFVVAFWRTGGLTPSVLLDVGIVAIDGPTERAIHVLAYAYPAEAERPLLASTTRAIRAYLEGAGYAGFGRGGKAGGGIAHVGGTKTMKTPAAAARECLAIQTGLAACLRVASAPPRGRRGR